jgi:hypothetical protein
MKKRIRHPKNKQTKKIENEKTHFVLEVHNGSMDGKTKFGK